LAKKQQPARGKGSRGLGHIDSVVGANLREHRIRAGLSQAGLGTKVGVTFQQIQKYENGSNAIATARLPAVCEALNISPNDLFGSLFKTGKTREPTPQLSSFAVKLALAIEQLPRRARSAMAELIKAWTGEDISE
jgi:transcriptional regulator with XRE-family HTH domain